jgi:uncharacterized membrane protein
MTASLLSQPSPAVRLAMRVILAVFFAVAGAVHLYAPADFIAITPSFVPYKPQVIGITGLCELAGAAGLLIPRLRSWAGIGLAAYALCVWPANFKHAFGDVQVVGLPDSWWYHGPRLAFQPVIIWWALYAAEVIDWPWRKPLPAARPHPAAKPLPRQKA